MIKSSEARQLTLPPILIRTDVNKKVGIGHLMRCLTISRVWKQKGGKVIFFLSSLSSAMQQFLEPYQLDVRTHKVEPGSKQDAERTLTLAHELQADWVIADGYWYGPEFQKTVASGAARLMLIDPLGAPQHNTAQIIVNANIYASEGYYRQRSQDAILLLGPKYLPLRPEFAESTPSFKDTSAAPKNILISLGGGDPDNVTSQVLRSLADFSDNLHLTAVIGPANENWQSLNEFAQNSDADRITLLKSPYNMPELMAQTDMAILAGGSTVWEAMYMGVPVILLSYAENQLRVVNKLKEMGLALYAGHFNGQIPPTFRRHCKTMLQDSHLRRQLSEQGRQLIDGRGSERIIQTMLTYTDTA